MVFWLLVAGILAGPRGLAAQVPDPRPPVIDTVVIIRHNVFTEAQTANSGFFRVMNKLHVITRERWIRRNLLFQQGEAYDSTLVDESERILRARQIFREIDIDTTRMDGRFAVVVRTQDGWSTKPKFNFSIASDGTWTGTFGVNEINLLGGGNQLYVAYDKEVDREGLNATINFQRLFGSDIDASSNYAGMSDGKNGNWIVGKPFRAFESRYLLQYNGLRGNQRVLQFVRTEAGALDTTIYQRSAFQSNVTAGTATLAQPTRYVRWVLTGGVRVEENVLQPDTFSEVPDSVTGTVGIYGEYSRARFREMQRFNGFGAEDIDLSTTFRLTANLAPELFGYAQTGIGPGVSLQTAVGVGSGFVWGNIDASGVITDAGLDSGRVVANLAFGWKPGVRHAVVAQIQAGALDNVRPGDEFDLGFQYPPRSWEPHSFVGTREVWISAEDRWYIWDALLGVVSAGVAAFFDYGGAWYDGQDSRFGGNVGFGLRFGSAVSPTPRTGRLDIGYRFGENVTGSRWVVSFGSGFVFPRKDIPVISYSAQPP